MKEIHIVAAVGTRCGIVRREPGREDGILEIVVRGPDETAWPHGVDPLKVHGQNTILDGYTKYVIIRDEGEVWPAEDKWDGEAE